METALLIVIGISVLLFGAELFVKGASAIATTLGVPKIVVGLTIVAFGTSSPELVVTLFAAHNQSTDLALGNVIGSNIANIFLILGIVSLFSEVIVQKNTTWKEIPFAFLSAIVLIIMANDQFLNEDNHNLISLSEGLILLSFFSIYLYYTLEIARKKTVSDSELNSSGHQQTVASSRLKHEVEVSDNGRSVMSIFKDKELIKYVAFFLAGLISIVIGGELFVGGAVNLARSLSISESVIGLTVVAIGTSLPELVTSIIAAKKGESDIVVGNVVGSCIFNIFWILGLTAIIEPVSVDQNSLVDILVLIAASLMLFFSMFVGSLHKLERTQGGFFLISYIGYISYLIVRG